MESNNGTYECPICGCDKPHAHTADEIYEDHLRALFEESYYLTHKQHWTAVKDLRREGYQNRSVQKGKGRFGPALWNRWCGRNPYTSTYSYRDKLIEALWRFFATSAQMLEPLAKSAGRRQGIEEAALLMENLWEKAETPGMVLLGTGFAAEIRKLLKTEGGDDNG